MTKHLLFLLFLLASLLSQAQLVRHSTLHFDNNVSSLNKTHLKHLDSLVASLSNIPEAYVVEVIGHTDHTGAIELNQKLSKDRGNTVLNYFKNNRFKTTDSSLKFFAFYKPIIAASDENAGLNRRVEIYIYARRLNMPKILGITDFNPKKYKLIEDEGGTILYDSTKITIAADAFLHADGTPVTGEIDVQYMEYRNPADFLLSGVPMSPDNGDSLANFNSAGMFRIRVFQNNQELVLKMAPEKNILVNLPLTDFTDQKFYGFDTTQHSWNGNTAIAITDAHGNMLPGFGGVPGAADRNGANPGDWAFCIRGTDTCAFMTAMVNKLNYLLSHDEPVRSDYPYKFMKNNVVDFKSPLYEAVHDKKSGKFQFVSRNAHDKLGVFSDYEWAYTGKDENRFALNNGEGYSYVKIIQAGSSKFKVNVDGRMISLIGTPKGYENAPKKNFFSFMQNQKNKEKAYVKNLRKLNRKNFKTYVSDTKELDKAELELEQELRKKSGLSDKFVFSKEYLLDSLQCLNSFYDTFLGRIDTTVLSIQQLNLRKDILAKKMRFFPSPFTCEEARKIIRKKNAEYRAFLEQQNKEMEKRRGAFAAFRLPSTGLFNADQIKSIQNARVIKAKYEDENGKRLKIISIYLNISSLNGIVYYNGSYGYSPYRFAYGKTDRSMIVAIDDKEKSYFCTPEEFAEAVKDGDGKTVLFKLKPLEKLETTDALKKIVSKIP